MLPSSFRYVVPTSLDDAVRELVAGGAEARILAGGQSLLPQMRARLAAPTTLIDINGLPGLDAIDEIDGELRIGALVRHADLEQAPLIRDRYPIIDDAARRIADPQIRNRGTFCGALAQGDPAGDWSAVAVALGAELHAVGPDGPSVFRAADFQTAMFATRLGANRILVEARVPEPLPQQGSAYLKIEQRRGDFAVAAAAVVVVLDGDIIRDASIALAGVGPTTVHAVDAAASLIGASIDDTAATEEAGRQAAAASSPVHDLRGPIDDKLALARVLTRRALRRAGDRARSEVAA